MQETSENKSEPGEPSLINQLQPTGHCYLTVLATSFYVNLCKHSSLLMQETGENKSEPGEPSLIF
jgi:hypothetical protein